MIEEWLPGGGVGGAVRVGDTVRRATGPWTPAVPTSGTSTTLTFNVLSGSGAYTFTNDIGPFTVNGLTFNSGSTNLLTIALGANACMAGGPTSTGWRRPARPASTMC